MTTWIIALAVGLLGVVASLHGMPGAAAVCTICCSTLTGLWVVADHDEEGE